MMNKEVNINEEKKKKYALVISFLVLMICIVGSTYAYFVITASNNEITGKVGGSSLDLTVTKVLPVDNEDNMIPQLEDALGDAISEDYNCIDGNGKVVCQVYEATVTNLGSEEVTLNGNISFTGIENMLNLKWKLLTDSRTIDSSKSSNSASTSEVSFVEDLNLTAEDTGNSSTYYFVFWIEETGELQTDNGEFRAIINFDSPNATSGVTSTITDELEVYAVYSETDNSLRFYNRALVSEGDTIELSDGTEVEVTAVYTDIETAAYNANEDFVPGWLDYSPSTIAFEDIISPISTSGWFYYLDIYCIKNVENFDNLDTSNVVDMSFMFAGCDLDLFDFSNFDTSNVTNMRYMFGDCVATNLDLSSFNTSNVTDMYRMFSSNYDLSSLNISSFDTSNVTDMDYMFYDCSSLKTIYSSDSFVTTNVSENSAMFGGCTNLVGGAGTVYDSDNVGKEYARIDGGINNPGYFTEKL